MINMVHNNTTYSIIDHTDTLLQPSGKRDVDESTPGDEATGENNQKRGKRSSIGDHHMWMIPFGILRWLVSIILLAGAVRTLDAGVISVVKPYGIYNIICVSTTYHFIL